MAYHPPVSLEEIKRRLKICHGNVVSIQDDTYSCVTKKACFIDCDHGEWWALPNLVARITGPRGHPARGISKISASKQLSINVVLDRLMEVHGKVVELDVTTFSNMQKKARFIDKDHGDWWASPGSVITKGTKHPSRSTSAMAKKRSLSVETLIERIHAVHGETIKLDVSTYKNSCAKARFVHETRGEWWATPWKIAVGSSHPTLRHLGAVQSRSRLSSMIHWRTLEPCAVQSTYEAAVINWLNQNKYDFDWQLPFTTNVMTPKGKKSVYYVDLFIKTGPLADTYVEIKGHWRQEISKQKWEWFHLHHPNSLLWTKHELQRLQIL